MYLRCERYRPLVHTPLIARSSLQYTGVSHFYTISPMQCSKLCSSEELFLFPFPSFLLKICRRASFVVVVVVVTHRRAFQITWSGAVHEERTTDATDADGRREGRFSPFHAAIFTVILCRTSRPRPRRPVSPYLILRGQMGCHTGNGGKLSNS